LINSKSVNTFLKKISYLLVCTLLAISCGFDNKTTDLITVSENDIILWNKDSFPLTMYIDNSFTASEVSSIKEASSLWEAAVEIDVFNSFPSFTPVNYSKTEDYYYLDDRMAIYKASHQVESLRPNILALTQLYIKLVKKIDGRQIFHIEHFDVFMNDFYFNFNDGGGSGEYDFKTIVLHEIGHVFGISGHIDNTIMNGYGSTNIVTHSIDPDIKQDLYDIYHIDLYQLPSKVYISHISTTPLTSTTAIVSFQLLKD